MTPAERRQRVAELTAQGLSTTTIAAMLHITTRTVLRARKATGCAQPAPVPLTAAELARAQILFDDGACCAEVARTLHRSHSAIEKHFPGYRWNRHQVAAASILGRQFARLERELRKTGNTA